MNASSQPTSGIPFAIVVADRLDGSVPRLHGRGDVRRQLCRRNLAAFPEVLKHHNGHPYFSYADTIMPSFMFAAGFSYRLSALRRFAKLGAFRAYGHFVVRSLALVLISLVMYAAEDLDVKKWSQMTPDGVWKLVGMLLKANLWEVLAIIGVVQILILPVIAASSRGPRRSPGSRCAVIHLVISQSFNFFFVYGKPNWMDDVVGLDRPRAWDGGFFGVAGLGDSHAARERSPTT